MDSDKLNSILAAHRREVLAAKALNSDLDFAFNLQMQEAITASLALKPSASPPRNKVISEDDADFDCIALMLEDIERVHQELRDREETERETRKMKEDLNRRIHDQKFANEIKSISDDWWREYGDNYHKPYRSGSSSSTSSSSGMMIGKGKESFRLYFKGLVGEERVRNIRVMVASVGVAICDPKDNLIWEVKKGLDLEGGKVMSVQMAEIEALVQGLDAALSLDLKSVNILCGDYMVTGRVEPRERSIATLVNQVALLQKKFIYCEPSLVPLSDIKFAFKFARDAIVSQIAWPVETSKGKSLKETCVICFEDIDVEKMFLVDGCYHRYCFSCMKQHVEVKLLNGIVVTCPHEECKTEINIATCGNFLDPKLVEIMSQRRKEASITATEKVYCPYPRCSALMSKTEVLRHTNLFRVGAEHSGERKCMKCGFFFCINCKAPWHDNMTCNDYSRSNSHKRTGDAMLKSLAKQKLWRQCVKCSHMVELSEGCYHITCRCGYEFCY
ncbi:uncharacterized protein LOC110808542, partial [Carica papaya]|uniref:uncharacterized protein LOC110808542 n=1 Tax=Carica papaya TaxID=3649 RepID=UPI000B8C7538